MSDPTRGRPLLTTARTPRAPSARWADAIATLAAALVALSAAGDSSVRLCHLAEAQRHCNTAEQLIEDLKREYEATSEGLLPTLPAQPAAPVGC